MTTSILDQVIANTTRGNGAKVVRENHDSINWLAGLADPGEMISCGYMAEARRQAGESDEAYVARLKRDLSAEQLAELEKACRPAAIRRASLYEYNGQVAFVGVGTTWHDLGTYLDKAFDSATALSKCPGINRELTKVPVSYEWNGTKYEMKDQFNVIYKDNGHKVSKGLVGSKYQIFQNWEAFRFVDAVLAEHGAYYETAGMLHDGSKVWILVNMPQSAFTLPGGDEMKVYGLFTNTHDTTEQAEFVLVTERVVCANTLRLALRNRGKGIKIRHTGNLASKVESARAAMGIASKKAAEFKAECEEMVKVHVDINAFIPEFLDAVLDVTQAQLDERLDTLEKAVKLTEADRILAAAERKKIEREEKKRAAIFEDMLARHETERCAGMGEGTAWTVLNCCTEAADFGPLGGRQVGTLEGKQSRRTESVISGKADKAKQVALEMVMELVEAAR